MWKKTSVITVLIMVISLFGCGDKSSDLSSMKQNKAVPEAVSIEEKNNTAYAETAPEPHVVSPETEKQVLETESPAAVELDIDGNETDIKMAEPEYSERLHTGIFKYYNYLGNDMDPAPFKDRFYRIISNASLYLYKVQSIPDYIILGTNGYPYSEFFGSSVIGVKLSDFIADMGESITDEEFANLIGIEMAVYDGPLAEPGFINRVGKSPYCRKDARDFYSEYMVYIYSPSDNPVNSMDVMSADSIIFFVNGIMNFNPLQCIERNSWIDNSEIMFSMERCPFVGIPYETEGMIVHAEEYDDGNYNEIEYEDPDSGWKYLIYDYNPEGKEISERSRVEKITLPSKDFFPDMPEKMSFGDFIKQYANVDEDTLYDRIVWEEIHEGELFIIGLKPSEFYPNTFTMNETFYVGAEIRVSLESDGCIHDDSDVSIIRNMAWTF